MCYRKSPAGLPTCCRTVTDYMAHLVEVQHERGATGGHTFHSLLSASLPPRRGELWSQRHLLTSSPLNVWLRGIYLHGHGDLRCIYKALFGCCVADSAEASRVKVTVEPPHSSVKMRAVSQVPVISPDDDLATILLQVLLTLSLIF